MLVIACATVIEEMLPLLPPDIIRLMLSNYKRLALINTGQYGLECYCSYARRTAERFGLRYEEIAGSTTR